MSISFLSSRFTQKRSRRLHRVTDGVITIEVRENSRYRWLTFADGVVQSAMSITDPAQLVLAYTHSMMASRIFNARPKRILCLGVGGGSLLRHLLFTLPSAEITAVDMSASVVGVAHDFFHLPSSDPRLRIEICDADKFAKTASGQDLVLVDLFNEQGMPNWLGGEAFLWACHSSLRDGGVLALNLMPESQGDLLKFLEVLRRVFSGRVLLTTLVDYRNVIALALKAPPTEFAVADLHMRAKELEVQLRIPLQRVLRNIVATNVCHDGKLVV